MVVDKGAAIIAVAQIVAESIGLAGQGRDVAWGFAVKTDDVEKQAQETRTEQVAPLREQALQADRAVFQAATIDTDPERHIGEMMLDVEMLEQGDQIGVARRVEDDEAHIDPRRLFGRAGIDGM